LNPNFAEAWNNKGNALSIQGKYNEAIEAYDEAIRLDSNLAGTWNNKALALAGLGRNAEANAAFAEAKELGYTGRPHL
jgi:tetratricopeptide (TPR) repeat protein